MRYADGQIVMSGDKISLAGDPGTICCCISDGFYDDAYPEEVWAYLEAGVILNVPGGGGLFHFRTTEDEEDLELVTRRDAMT